MASDYSVQKKKSPFAPMDIIIKMSHMKSYKEKVWQEFLRTKPNNHELCLAVCRAYIVKEKAYEELLKNDPTKEDFIFLFEHLRDSKLINYKIWEIFKKREDLERVDFERVLRTKRIDSVTAREAKIRMRRYPEPEETKEETKEEAVNNKEKGCLTQQQNDFIIKRKKRLIKPWERDHRDPMHS